MLSNTNFIRSLLEIELNCKNVEVKEVKGSCEIKANIDLTKVIELATKRNLSIRINKSALSFEPTSITAAAYKTSLANHIIKQFELSDETDPIQLQMFLEKILPLDKVPYDTVQRIRMLTGVNDIQAEKILQYILLNLADLDEEQVEAQFKDLNLVTAEFEAHLDRALTTLKIKDWQLLEVKNDQVLTVKNYKKEDYEKLAKDLAPDFNASFNGTGLIFNNVK